MSTIGHVTMQSDGSFKGAIKTLAINAPLTFVPNTTKTDEKQPDYKIFTTGNVELGAAWIKKGKKSGENYVSLSLSDPSFRDKLYANLGRAAGQDNPDVFAMIWDDK